jgi:hypothetical protein
MAYAGTDANQCMPIRHCCESGRKHSKCVRSCVCVCACVRACVCVCLSICVPDPAAILIRPSVLGSTEKNREQLVLFATQDGTFGPWFVTIHRIPVMWNCGQLLGSCTRQLFNGTSVHMILHPSICLRCRTWLDAGSCGSC